MWGYEFFGFRSMKLLKRNVPSVNSPSEVLTWTNFWTCQRKYLFPFKKCNQNLKFYLVFREQLVELLHARARRRFSRGLKRKPLALIKKLRKAKKEAPPNEKPEIVKTHLRNMIIVPEMVGSIVGVYNGKAFNQVEIKPEMIGHYLGEFSVTYKPVKHGRPGIGATHSSRFIPLK